MFNNYIKIALRNIQKQKLNSTLNIIGLAVAIVCSLLILFHVKDELSYEKCFPKEDRIYRVTINSKYGDTYRHWAVGPLPLGMMLKEEIPEIETVARFLKIGTVVISYNSLDGSPKQFEEKGGFFADSSAVTIFDLQFIEGDSRTALTDAYTIVLTSSIARKFFGNESPLGKTLILDDSQKSYKITGVIEDTPSNTHLQFDYLISMSSFYKNMIELGREGALTSRTWKTVYTYVLLGSKQRKTDIEAKLPVFTQNFLKDIPNREEHFYLQPIADIHLHSKLEQEMAPNSDIVYVYIFSIAAIFILIIASVNFVNISTAQAFKRLKEVGVRKVLGAQRRQLVKQFLGESFVLVISATLIALVLLQLLIPFYNNLSGKDLYFAQLFSTNNLLLLFILIFAIGLMSGLYPAIFISSFQPASSIKSMKDPQSSVTLIRKGLVIFQFVISIFMIFSTITIYRQLVYFREKDLGFDKERLIAVQLYGDLYKNIMSNKDAIKAELLKYAAISNVAFSSNLPGERFSVEHLRPKGVPENEDIPTVRVIRVDEDFLNTMKIDLIAGRKFRPPLGEEGQFILSESAVKALDLKDPIRKKAQAYSGSGEIIGIMNDFNFASLHQAIEPLVLDYRPTWVRYLIVKFQGATVPEVLKYVQEKLDEITPNHLFRYSFIDENLNQLYVFEDRVSDIFKVFSVLAILISCLGLFGLSVYSAELRIKEIGIRKAVGATTSGIVTLLTKEFMVWIIIAIIIAYPIAFFAMNNWLKNFAYRISIEWWTLILAGIFALMIALLTVSYQSIKAALANPVESLRYE